MREPWALGATHAGDRATLVPRRMSKALPHGTVLAHGAAGIPARTAKKSRSEKRSGLRPAASAWATHVGGYRNY